MRPQRYVRRPVAHTLVDKPFQSPQRAVNSNSTTARADTRCVADALVFRGRRPPAREQARAGVRTFEQRKSTKTLLPALVWLSPLCKVLPPAGPRLRACPCAHSAMCDVLSHIPLSINLSKALRVRLTATARRLVLTHFAFQSHKFFRGRRPPAHEQVRAGVRTIEKRKCTKRPLPTLV